MKERNRAIKSLATVICSALFCSSALANPVLGNVDAGNVSIQQTSNSTVVNQSSKTAIINWQSFNINTQQSTHFQQPAGGIALNRISATDGPSSINGRLSATGQIILINPAGIFFGKSAFVKVGGMIATTGNISDYNFLNRNYQFTNISPNSTIINQGKLIAANHGLIALIGGNVTNTGLIQANLGHVVLATGDAVTMNFDGNDLINFSVDTPIASGSINNLGSIIANGGSVLITANTAEGVLDTVINMDGVVQANSVGKKNGSIILSANNNTGVVDVTGKLIAAGKNSGETGGNINITGYNILIDNPAVINVSGNAGGGNIYIGGNFHGAGPLPNANATVIAPQATLSADAISNGNGGNIAIWSDNFTKVYGTISAQGGASGGNGGFIETSSHNYLDINGLSVNTSASHGNPGTWLLDPSNIFIALNQADATAAGMTGTDSSANTGSGVNPETFAATGIVQDSLLTTGTLTTALNSTDVIVSTTNTNGTGLGNITVVDPITWSSTHALTLSAANNIVINAAITGTGGALNLSAANASQSITTGTSGTINVNNFNLTQGQWYQVTNPLPSFEVITNFQINSGTLPNTNAQFIRALSGNGGATPYSIADIYGLQGVASTIATLNYNYQLNNNIDATNTRNWNSGAGFVPIGTGQTTQKFFGTFEGNNYTVNNLYINLPSTTYVGLFGITTNTIQDIGVTNANITGNTYVGALNGYIYSGTNTNNYSSGTVTGSLGGQVVGGLIGRNFGTLSNSYSSATVSGDTYVGGLAGASPSNINNSYSTGSVSGNTYVGGLVGRQTATVSNSYSSSSVSGTTNVGGFTGEAAGTVNNSYSSGSVTGTTAVGGFAGLNSGTINNSFWDTATSGQSSGVGSGSSSGTTGLTTAQSMSYTSVSSIFGTSTGASAGGITSTVATSATLPNYTWFIFDGSTRPMLISEIGTPNTTLSGVVNISSPHQLQLIGMAIGTPGTAPSVTYTLINNIDLTSGMNNASDVWGTNQSLSSGSGFYPIGTSSRFAENFNGNFYTINNLYINSSTNGTLGLIGTAGVTANTQSLSDVTLTNGTIVDGTAGSNAAIFLGLGNLTSGSGILNVTGISVTGSVDANAASTSAGGVVGYTDSFTGGTINIDYSYSGANITEAANLSSGLGSTNFGSLVGRNASGIYQYDYATGSVTIGNNTSNNAAGGFMGYNETAGHITNSYSTGAVTVGTGLTGTNTIGGFLGRNNGGAGTVVVTNSLWDTNTSGQSTGIGSNSGSTTITGFLGGCFGGVSCTTPSGTTNGNVALDLSLLATYTNSTSGSGAAQGAGWSTTAGNAGSITSSVNTNSTLPNYSWFIFQSPTNTRPMLVYELGTPNSSPTSSNISTAHQLQLAGTTLGGNFNLGSNINLNNAMNNAADIWGTNAGTPTGNGFVPIGDGTSLYTGTFNGENYVISNLYINRSSSQYQGLFGSIIGAGIVENTGLTNVSITGSDNTGALIGYNQTGAQVINSYSTGSVSGGGTVGGLVGYNGGGNIYRSFSAANTSGSLAIGGLAGNFDGGIINNSYATGTVTTSLSWGGGLIGNISGSAAVSNSYSTGYVSGAGTLGGLIGNGSGTVTSSYWNQDTSGQNSSAGGTIESNSNMMLQATFSGWDFSNTWNILSGQSYPYLMGVYNTTPRVISGIAYTDTSGTTPISGGNKIKLVDNGSVIDTVSTSANGLAYFLESNGTISDNSDILMYLSGAGTQGNVVAIAPTSGGSLTDLSILASTVNVGRNSTSSTISNSTLATVKGSLSDSDILYSVSGSNISVSSNNIRTTSNTTYQVNGNLSATNGNITMNGPVLITTANPTITASTSGDITIANTISGGGNALTVATDGSNSSISGVMSNLTSFTKSGSGTLKLTTVNTYSGSTTVTAGTLQNGVANALPTATALSISASGTYDLNAFAQTVGSLTGAGTLTDSGATQIFTTNDSGTDTFSGDITGNLALTMNGSGSLTLSGNNTFSGGTNINSGSTIILGNNAALGSPSGTTLATINSGSTLDVASQTLTIANGESLSVNGTGVGSNGALISSGTGTIAAAGNGNVNLAASSSLGGTGILTISAPITGAGNALTKTGTGTLVLSSTSNTYSGGTIVSAGTLKNAATNALPTSTALSIGASGTYDLNAFAQTIGSLSGSGNLTDSGAAQTFTSNDNAADTFSGTISGNLALTMGGTGSLTLSGSNSYTGGTNINSGSTIILGNNAALGSPTGTALATILSGGTLDVANQTLSIPNGLTLDLNGTGVGNNGALVSSGAGIIAAAGSGSVNLASASTIAASGTLTVSAPITGSGTLTIQGPGTVNITSNIGSSTSPVNSLTVNNANTAVTGSVYTINNQTYDNPVNLAANTIYSSSSGNILFNNIVNGANTLTINSAGTITFNNPVGTVTPLSSLSVSSGGTTINSGIITTSGSQSYNGLVTLGSDTTLTINNAGANSIAINSGVTGNKNLILASSTSGNTTFSLNGSIGANNVTITGNAGSTNSLSVNSGNSQTWNITASSIGNVDNVNGVSGTFNFSNIQNLTGGTNGNNFIFANNAYVSGTVNGNSLANTNSFNFSSYSSPVNVVITSSATGSGRVTNNSGNTLFTFSNINNTNNSVNYPNASLTVGGSNKIVITNALNGFISDPYNFNNFQRIVSTTGSNSVEFDVSAIINALNGTAIINGITMYFVNISLISNAPASTPNVSAIVQQPSGLQTTSTSTSIWNNITTTASNINSLIQGQIDQNNNNISNLKIVPNCFKAN